MEMRFDFKMTRLVDRVKEKRKAKDRTDGKHEYIIWKYTYNEDEDGDGDGGEGDKTTKISTCIVAVSLSGRTKRMTRTRISARTITRKRTTRTMKSTRMRRTTTSRMRTAKAFPTDC